MTDAHLAGRLLAVMETELLPATADSVAQGNKVFGAALLDRESLQTVLVGTNNETACPLWHGEVHTIKLYHERLGGRPGPERLIFLSSHEPCPMCLSAIAWAGFREFHYLFTYEDSRDAFAIPHDINMLSEIFRLDGRYAQTNSYWSGHDLTAHVAALPDAQRHPLEDQIGRIRAAYADLSALYQTGKGGAGIPLD